jgi:hypothetical protein
METQIFHIVIPLSIMKQNKMADGKSVRIKANMKPKVDLYLQKEKPNSNGGFMVMNGIFPFPVFLL